MNRHTITVDAHAVPAHLAHGDYIGECSPPAECEIDIDCDDSVFCNGVERCEDGSCQNGVSPCDAGQVCSEPDVCSDVPECVSDSDCTNHNFCDGIEVCVDGSCEASAGSVCDDLETCDEDYDLCVPAPECENDEDCDDGVFCTGHEVCVAGSCAEPVARCALGEICNESLRACLSDSGEGEGEGEGETEPAEGEGEGEGEGDPPLLTPRQTPAPDRGQISGSAFWACSQSSVPGLLGLLAVPLLLIRRSRKIAALAFVAMSVSANAEPLTNTIGAISKEDTIHVRSPDLSGPVEIGTLADLAHAPVTFRDSEFRLIRNAVDNQVLGRLSGAFRIMDRLQLDIAIPFGAALGNGIVAGRTVAAGAADSEVGLRLVLGEEQTASQVALTLHAGLPSSFLSLGGQPVLGEAMPTIVPGVAGRLKLDNIKFLANASYTARMPKQVADFRLGHTFNLSAAGVVGLTKGISVFLEARNSFSSSLLGSNRVFAPIEGGGGLRFEHRNFFGSAYIGGGLLPDVGVPLVRGTASLGFTFDPFYQPAPSLDSPTSVEHLPATKSEPENVLVDATNSGDNSIAKIDGDRIVVLQPVLFYFDSDRLKPESEPVLKEVAEVLIRNPQIRLLQVEGHASADGEAAHNAALSGRRARAVVRHLIDLGVTANLRPIGFGEDRPRESNDTVSGRRANRRVEFVILSEDN